MVKINKKDILHHFILNLFTILNAEILGCKLKKNTKQKVLNLVKIASLVISNEKFFLNDEIKFFKQKVNINDIVDIVIAVNKPKKSTILLHESNYVFADKHYLIEALKYLILKLCETANSLNFSFDKITNTLIIKHDGPKIKTSTSNSILNSLNISTLTTNEISYKFALAIFKTHKIKIKNNKNCLLLKFSKQS
jgi:hypothetical protein